MFQKCFEDYIVHVNEYQPIEIRYILYSQSGDNEAPSSPFLGEDLIRAVLAIFYHVIHSFYIVFLVMKLGRKIQGLIEDNTEALHGF